LISHVWFAVRTKKFPQIKFSRRLCRIPVWPFVYGVKAVQNNGDSMRKLRIIEHISLDGVIQVSGEWAAPRVKQVLAILRQTVF
jgi:hypothetical protein